MGNKHTWRRNHWGGMPLPGGPLLLLRRHPENNVRELQTRRTAGKGIKLCTELPDDVEPRGSKTSFQRRRAKGLGRNLNTSSEWRQVHLGLGSLKGWQQTSRDTAPAASDTEVRLQVPEQASSLRQTACACVHVFHRTELLKRI